MEAVIVISSREDDSLIFCKKSLYTKIQRFDVEQYTMPLTGWNSGEVLLGHLKDHDSGVRVEVIERQDQWAAQVWCLRRWYYSTEVIRPGKTR